MSKDQDIFYGELAQHKTPQRHHMTVYEFLQDRVFNDPSVLTRLFPGAYEDEQGNIVIPKAALRKQGE